VELERRIEAVPQTVLSESAFHSFVKSILRKASMRWGPLNRVKAKARVERGFYKCAACAAIVPATAITTLKNGKVKRVKNVAIDHIAPVVPLTGFDSWDGVIDRLFCDEEGLQLLCRDCHEIKCQEETSGRKLHRS
jgi:hypothetical protein